MIYTKEFIKGNIKYIFKVIHNTKTDEYKAFLEKNNIRVVFFDSLPEIYNILEVLKEVWPAASMLKQRLDGIAEWNSYKDSAEGDNQ